MKVMFSAHSLVTYTFVLLLSCVLARVTGGFTPSKYVLEIKTDLEQKTYSGKVVITVNCGAPSDTIKLNALKSKLSIDQSKVLVYLEGQNTNLVEKSQWDPSTDVFVIKIKSALQYGAPHTITVPFEGKMADGVQEGYYIIQDGDGLIAASQFNNLQARSAFPCFEERFLKANIKVILHRREKEKSISSMPLEKTIDKVGEVGWKTDEYKMTEIEIPPHLIVFVVTNIPLTSTPDCDKHIKYWFNTNSKRSEEAGKLACKEADQMSTSLTKTFSLPPLETSVSKLDVLTHPSFPYCERGGWGLILSSESPHTEELWDFSDKFVTFERLAFQYFGGIVTYDSIASAQFYQAFVVYLAESLLDEKNDFSYVVQHFLTIDGPMLTNQFVGEFDPQYYKWKSVFHNIHVPWDADHYGYYLDSIGTLVIRMIHQTVGNVFFQNSLRDFFKKYKNKYASEAEFWKSLNSVSKPVYEKMYSPITRKLEKSSWLKSSDKLPDWYKHAIGHIFTFKADFANLPFGVSVSGIAKTWTDGLFPGDDTEKQVSFRYPMIRVQRQDQTIHVTQEPFQGNWVKKNERKRKNVQEAKKDENNPKDAQADEKKETKSTEVKVLQKKDTNSKEMKNPQNKEIKKKIVGEKLWWIPLTYTTANRPDFNKMEPTGWAVNVGNTKRVRLYAKTDKNDWIIFNIKSAGLYRVLYEEENWLLIIKALNDAKEMQKINYLNRMQLVRDVLDFAFLGDLQYDIAFKLISYLQHEDNTFVWTVFLHHIENLESAIRKSNYYDEYQGNMKKLMSKIYKKAFPPLSVDEDRNEAAFKQLVLRKSAATGVDDLVTLCRTKFDKWKTEGVVPKYSNWFQKEIITYGLSVSLSVGSNDDFEFVFNKLIESSENDKNREVYLTAFQYVSKKEHIDRLLNWAFSTESRNVLKEKSQFVRILTTQPKSLIHILNYLFFNIETIQLNTNIDDLTTIFRILALESDTTELTVLTNLVDTTTDLNMNEEISRIIEQGNIGNDRRKEWLSENQISLDQGFKTWKNLVSK